MNESRRPEPTDDAIRGALTREPDTSLTQTVAREVSLALAGTPQRRRGIRWPWSPALVALGPSPMRWRVGLVTNLVILALLVALAVAALAFVGSMRRLPPPYGLANPGLIAFDAGGDIVVEKADGTDRRRLTTGAAEDVQPTWSPDGTRLAYQSLSPDGTMVDIIVMDADGSHPRVVATKAGSTGLPGFATVPWPKVSWAPDSRHLLYTGAVAGRPRMFIASEDGSSVTQVGPPNLDGEDPDWSPDGSRIAFFGGRYDNERGVYVMDGDGSNIRRLTSLRPGEWSTVSYRRPIWSPDGSLIAYSVAVSSKTSEARVLNVETGDERIVSRSQHDAYANSDARWSPDGSWIAWLAWCCGDRSSHLVVARADGSAALEFPAEFTGVPVWSPDGRSLFIPHRGAARVDDPTADKPDGITIVDVASRTMTTMPAGGADLPLTTAIDGDGSWQRLAR